MRQAILVMFLVSVLLAALWYFGGYALLAGLIAITLVIVIFGAFALGASWSRKLMGDGARLAIESSSRNDQFDAVKIKALAELTREAIKAKNEALPAPGGFPALPPFNYGQNTIDGAFTIAGLDEEQIQ
jgi:hypothetical protein